MSELRSEGKQQYLVLASKSSERVEESMEARPGLETEEDLVWLLDLSVDRVSELDAGRLV